MTCKLSNSCFDLFNYPSNLKILELFLQFLYPDFNFISSFMSILTFSNFNWLLSWFLYIDQCETYERLSRLCHYSMPSIHQCCFVFWLQCRLIGQACRIHQLKAPPPLKDMTNNLHDPSQSHWIFRNFDTQSRKELEQTHP